MTLQLSQGPSFERISHTDRNRATTCAGAYGNPTAAKPFPADY
jgi:hypothetical protein